MADIDEKNNLRSRRFQNKKRMTIACVIPAYNEERFIARVISGLPAFIDWIIVVNDASKDSTAEVVRALSHPRVILVDHEKNRGVGGAMISGYQKALEIGADIVVKVDGDGQMDASNIWRLITPLLLGEADYAKGVRFRDSDVLYRMPFVRLMGNLGLSFLAKAASGYWNIFDPTNGFTALGRQALEYLRLDRLANGYFFETSMLINLYRTDAVVVDVPMKARYGDEQSKLSPTKVLFTFPFLLFRALCKRILWRYFIRDFNAFSAFFLFGSALFLGGFFFGLDKWIRNAIRHVGTPTGTIMLAAVPLILGFQLLIQAVVLDVQNVPAKPLQRSSLAFDDEPAAPPQEVEAGSNQSSKFN